MNTFILNRYLWWPNNVHPVVFALLVPTSTSSTKSNERSTIFVGKLPLDVPLNTGGERHTGNPYTTFNVIFINPIKEITILLLDETAVKIMPHLIVLPPLPCWICHPSKFMNTFFASQKQSSGSFLQQHWQGV